MNIIRIIERNINVHVKQIGNNTEKEFANMMFKKGWWVYMVPNKINGQPFDIIMAKNDISWFIDVKNVNNKDYFLLSRIEPNQKSSMSSLYKKGNFNIGFAIKFDDDDWRFLRFKNIDFEKRKIYKDEIPKLKPVLFM
jgi:Holliday junction resolvase